MTNGYISQVARSVPFDNSSNGFTANETQAAIEEVKAYVENFPRYTFTLIYNATVPNGAFIGYNDSISNKKIIFPITTHITEFTWANANTNLGNFTFEFYKNGTSVGNKIYTYTPTTQQKTNGYGFCVIATHLEFSDGDFLYIKYVIPSGTNLNDLSVVLFLERNPAQ